MELVRPDIIVGIRSGEDREKDEEERDEEFFHKR
jgi:hypothetical protein